MWRLIAGAVMAGAALGQTPKFEVVSVKPCPVAPASGGRLDASPGRLRVECMTVRGMISYAFLQFADGKAWPVNPQTGSRTMPITQAQLMQEIRGAPAWVNKERFTVDAKPAAAESQEMIEGPMLASLLRDRFHLRLHKETREVPVFDLTVDKSGAKLTPMKDGSCIVWVKGNTPPMKRQPGQGPPIMCGGLVTSEKGGIDAHGVEMPGLCRRLALALDRDIIDKTGLKGAFDFHLELTQQEILIPMGGAGGGNNEVARDPGGTIAPALRKVGLRLEPSKAKMDFLVIDSVARPTAN